VFEVICANVEVTVLDAAPDAIVIRLHADGDSAIERDRERLRTTHAAETGGESDRACQRTLKALSRNGGESLVRALQDALRADIDPRAGRHLAVHRQTERLQAAELVPGRPFGHQHRVGDEDSRRPLVGVEDAHRLA